LALNGDAEVSQLEEFIRIVALRKGEFRSSEFMLRKGDNGLSLFANKENPSPTEAIEAVRMMGKRGVLIAVLLKKRDITNLGLTIAQTSGGTENEKVNGIHFEARLPYLKRFWLRLWGIPPHEYFNQFCSQKLFRLARVLE